MTKHESATRPTIEDAQAAMQNFKAQENIFAISLSTPPDDDRKGPVTSTCSIVVLGEGEVLMNGIIQMMRDSPIAAAIVLQASELYKLERLHDGIGCLASLFRSRGGV